MQTAAPADVQWTELALPISSSQKTLALRQCQPGAGAALAQIVVAPAMGVLQSYYQSFVRWLAEQGYGVTTFDYRGHGLSLQGPLRDAKADLLDWAQDCELVALHIKKQFPGQSLIWIGHSVGSQLPGLASIALPINGLLSVGSGSGYTNRIACYSRFPILSARVLDYASSYNGSVLYELKLNEDTITLINNHLESNKLTKADKDIYEEILKAPETEKVKSGARLLLHKLAEASAIRAPQADTIAREIASSRHPSVIVCGDFNDTPISYAHRVIAQNLDDAFTQSGRGLGISYNQNKFYFRIDNILISKNLRSYNCTVDRSIRESDHYPIWCYIAKRQ